MYVYVLPMPTLKNKKCTPACQYRDKHQLNFIYPNYSLNKIHGIEYLPRIVFNSLLTVQIATADSIISATADIYSVIGHTRAAYARSY